MNSPERASRPVFGPPVPYRLRHRAPALPDRAPAPPPPRPTSPALNGFSVARLYSSFQCRRTEHFPEELSESAFGLLVDLFQYEWLNRRIGAPAGAGMGVSGGDACSAAELVEADLVLLERSSGPDAAAAIRLTPSGRVRIGTFFDAMASYISRL